MLAEHALNAAASAGGERISDHLELLSTMSRDFAFSMDIEETLRRALARIADYMDAEGGALFLLQGGRLVCRVCVGPVDITGTELAPGEGIVGRAVARNAGEMVRDVAADPNFHAAVDARSGFVTRSILCAPMSVKDERIGAIEMVNKRGGDGLFSDSDLHMLMVLSASAALAILNARMAEALVEQERVRRELELAAEIQRNLLPPAAPGRHVAGLNRPARRVSGDFFDHFELPDGRVAFGIGDVSGKGMDAALLMAKACSLFHCLGKSTPQPGRLLSVINREICETATGGRFVTMAAGVYDPARHTVRLASAGHEPALLHRRDGGFDAFPAGAPPLGIGADVIGPDGPAEEEFALDGGTLYLFTDGLTEGYVDGDATLGGEGVRALLAEHARRPLVERLAAVLDRVDQGERPLRDDLTILAVEDRA